MEEVVNRQPDKGQQQQHIIDALNDTVMGGMRATTTVRQPKVKVEATIGIEGKQTRLGGCVLRLAQ